MNQVARRLLVCTLICLLVAATPSQAADLDLEIAVPADARSIHTDGQFIVWVEEDSPSGVRNLYAASIADGQRRLVARGLFHDDTVAQPELIALDNATVLWVEGRDAQRVLRANNLVTGSTVTIATGEVTLPAIAGTFVTWWEQVNRSNATEGQSPALLKARDLAGTTEPRLLAQTANTLFGWRASTTNGRWVAWSKATGATRPGSIPCWEISVISTSGGAPKVVHEAGCDTSGEMELVGDWLYYDRSDAASGDIRGDRLVRVNLTTGERVTSEILGAMSRLSSDGRYVFWSSPQIPTPLYDDLMGYDIQTRSVFLVERNYAKQGGYAPSSMPRVRGGQVVWLAQNEAGHTTIKVTTITRLLPGSARPSPSKLDPATIHFPETNHMLSGSFKTYWEQRGGLPVFGYPLSEAFVQFNRDLQRSYPVQYFERQRFEHHPEQAGTPYEVLLGRLGAEELARRGRDWQQEPKASPMTPHYFPQTGHAIAEVFWRYWRNQGLEFGDVGVSEREALALWGYPLTEPRTETNSSGDTIVTQWFERARFEHHPNNSAPYNILLGRLGDEVITSSGWK